MALRIDDLERWVARKKAEVRYAQGYNDAMNDVRRIVGGDA